MRKITAADIGAMYELRACQFLMEQGLNVFRNQSPNGVADIITLNPNTMEVVCYDVKAMRPYHKLDGSISYASVGLKAEQIRKNVKRIAIFNDIIIIDDGKSANLNEAVAEFLKERLLK